MRSEPVLTKRDVARKLKVSTRTVERLHLPSLRVGGQNRYRWSEVERHLRGIPEAGAKIMPFPNKGEAA